MSKSTRPTFEKLAQECVESIRPLALWANSVGEEEKRPVATKVVSQGLVFHGQLKKHRVGIPKGHAFRALNRVLGKAYQKETPLDWQAVYDALDIYDNPETYVPSPTPTPPPTSPGTEEPTPKTKDGAPAPILKKRHESLPAQDTSGKGKKRRVTQDQETSTAPTSKQKKRSSSQPRAPAITLPTTTDSDNSELSEKINNPPCVKCAARGMPCITLRGSVRCRSCGKSRIACSLVSHKDDEEIIQVDETKRPENPKRPKPVGKGKATPVMHKSQTMDVDAPDPREGKRAAPHGSAVSGPSGASDIQMEHVEDTHQAAITTPSSHTPLSSDSLLTQVMLLRQELRLMNDRINHLEAQNRTIQEENLHLRQWANEKYNKSHGDALEMFNRICADSSAQREEILKRIEAIVVASPETIRITDQTPSGQATPHPDKRPVANLETIPAIAGPSAPASTTPSRRKPALKALETELLFSGLDPPEGSDASSSPSPSMEVDDPLEMGSEPLFLPESSESRDTSVGTSL